MDLYDTPFLSSDDGQHNATRQASGRNKFSMADALKHLTTGKSGDESYETREFIYDIQVLFSNGELTAEQKLLEMVQNYQKFSMHYKSVHEVALSMEDLFVQRSWNNVSLENLEFLYNEILEVNQKQKQLWYKCSKCSINYPEEKFACTSCNATFFHFVGMQQHINKKHLTLSANSNLSCTECGKFFGEDINAMMKHFESTHICKQGHEMCPVGCKTLLPVSKNPEHSVYHHVAKKHVCVMCNEKTVELSKHSKWFHDVASSEHGVGSQRSSVAQSRSNLPGSSSSLKDDSLSNNATKRNSAGLKKTPGNFVSCASCGFSFPINGYPCEQCPEKFDYYADIVLHTKLEHMAEVNYDLECQVCHVVLDVEQMSHHVSSEHPCSSLHLRCPKDCLQLFPSEFEVMQHLESVHYASSSLPSTSGVQNTPNQQRSGQFRQSNKASNVPKVMRQTVRNSKFPSAQSNSLNDSLLESNDNGEAVQSRSISSKPANSFSQWEEYLEECGPVSLGLPGFLVYLSPLQRVSVSSGTKIPCARCSKCKLTYPKSLYACQNCDMVFCTPGSLAFHEEMTHKKLPEVLQCYCCSERFDSCNSLMAHELEFVCNNHFECPFGCDSLISNRVKLREHLRTFHVASAAPSTANMIPFGLSTYRKNNGRAQFHCRSCKLVCLPPDKWGGCKLCDGMPVKEKRRYIVGLEFLAHLVRFHKLNVSMKLSCATCAEPFVDVVEFQHHQKNDHSFCVLHDICTSTECGTIFHHSEKNEHVANCPLAAKANKEIQNISSSDSKLEELKPAEPFSLSKPDEEEEVLGSISSPIRKKIVGQNITVSLPNKQPLLGSGGYSRPDVPPVIVPSKRVVQEVNPNFVRIDFEALRNARRIAMDSTPQSQNHPFGYTGAVRPIVKRPLLGDAPGSEIPHLMTMSVRAPGHMPQNPQFGTMCREAASGPPMVKRPRQVETDLRQLPRTSSAAVKRKSCNKCPYRYDRSELGYDHFCAECSVYFVKDFELLFHLTVSHAVEMDFSTRFRCDMCYESSEEFEINDLLAHRGEVHKSCLAHMRCGNEPCEFFFSSVDEMLTHQNQNCRSRQRKVNPSVESKQHRDETLDSPKKIPRQSKEPDFRAGRDLSPGQKSTQVLSFEESKKFFNTRKAADVGMSSGCSNCGQVKPVENIYECRLCKTGRISEKRFVLYLEALLHLIKKHAFQITDIDQTCNSPECADEIGQGPAFEQVEEYYNHGVQVHGLCPSHFICPLGCGLVLNMGYSVTIHTSKCRARTDKLTM